MNEELVRINKYLSQSGICSRREADRLIADGSITVNGSVALPGMKVSAADEICIDGKPISSSITDNKKVLLAYNKPVGIVCSSVNQGNEKNNIIDAINYPQRIYPIGRLDKDSEGLIFLTNDGELSDRIQRSRNHYEKEYEVIVDKHITDDFIKKMQNGVEITFKDDSKYLTKKCKASVINKNTFRIVLTEGKNRQIRRMCEALGVTVVSLKRIRILNISLGDIPVGKYIELDIKSLKLE